MSVYRVFGLVVYRCIVSVFLNISLRRYIGMSVQSGVAQLMSVWVCRAIGLGVYGYIGIWIYCVGVAHLQYCHTVAGANVIGKFDSFG